MIYRKLGIQYDVDRLWNECCKLLIEPFGWGKASQICLTHRPDESDPIKQVFGGVGSLYGLKERDFSKLNNALKGSYIEEVYSKIPYPIGRLRLMRVKPRGCYSVHRDTTMRIHLPLITDAHALMIFPDDSTVVHLPADGHMYLTDTRRPHTAMNGSLNERFHLVGALCEEE